MSKKKKNLLMDIVTSDQLTIELVFGKAAWEKFLELQPDDEIVVVGNGPVCSYHGEYIENAKMVMRCNHYQEQTSSGEGRRKWFKMRCAIRLSPWSRAQNITTAVFV